MEPRYGVYAFVLFGLTTASIHLYRLSRAKFAWPEDHLVDPGVVDCGFSPLASKSSKTSPGEWFQKWWEPCHSCMNIQRLGRRGDGGKWTCLDLPLTTGTIVSVGSNNDFSYERSIGDVCPTCKIHVYDPTSEPPPKPIRNLVFHKYELTPQDLLEHGRVRVLKLDCEGCEVDIIHALPEASVAIDQIQVEIHWTRYINPVRVVTNIWATLTKCGYVTFSKEPNIQFWASGHAVEYSLVKRATL